MRKTRIRSGVMAASAAIVLATLFASPLSGDESSDRLRVFGVTDDGRLIRFRSDNPERARSIDYISGLTGADSKLVGIDFRVQDGHLYGVADGGGVYRIDTTTAAATFVNSLSVPLSGKRFGVDFNPAADRLRVISDTGQNLAHNVDPAGVTAMNGVLTYTPPPAAPVAALGVTGAAYTNNDLNQPATGTTLFDLDTTLEQIVVQSPPGNGILVATGQLRVDAGTRAGFDIHTTVTKGVATANRGFASLSLDGKYGFFRIDLLTGEATRIGFFDDNVVDIAIPLDQ